MPRIRQSTPQTPIIDNGRSAPAPSRFETGRLARQAAGSVAAYLDDETMLLSATTARKNPKDQPRLLPADGRRRGADVRRGAHPRLVLPPRGPAVRGRDPHLPAHRPAAAPVVRQGPAQRDPGRHHGHGARPQGPLRRRRDQRRVGVHPARRACRSAARSAPPASRSSTASGSRSPTHEQLESAVFDMVVAGRVVGDDVAIMMVEAEATTSAWSPHHGRRKTAPTEEVVAQGLEAAKPFIAVALRGPAAARRRGRQADRASSRASSTTRTTSSRPSPTAVTDAARPAALTIADKQERETELDRVKALAVETARRPVRGSREGDQRGLPLADQEARPPARPARQGPHRRPWPHRHPHAVGRGRGAPAGARLGAVRARRDPDPRRHHAQHAAHGAAARHARARDAQALHAQLQLPALLHR